MKNSNIIKENMKNQQKISILKMVDNHSKSNRKKSVFYFSIDRL